MYQLDRLAQKLDISIRRLELIYSREDLFKMIAEMPQESTGGSIHNNRPVVSCTKSLPLRTDERSKNTSIQKLELQESLLLSLVNDSSAQIETNPQ